MTMIKLTLFSMIATILSVSIGQVSAQDATKVSLQKTKSAPKYPAFSWDTIPRYMHIRKATAYTPEEIAFIAKFPLITFEKSNGHTAYGTTEKGTLIAAREVKKINPDAVILYYRNVIVHYSSYGANEALKDIDGAFLEDKNGNNKLIRKKVPAYDLSDKKLREWWVKTCSDLTADPAIDGLFLDGNIKALEPGYLRRDIGESKKSAVEAGYHKMMKDTRKAIGPDKLIIANILRARFKNAGLEYMDYFDGSYLEAFEHNVGKASYEDYIAKGIDAMQKASSNGKIIAYSSGLGGSENKSNMGIDEAHGKAKSEEQLQKAFTYQLGIFLISAGEHSYFRPHEGYAADKEDKWMRWFPEYDKPLGAPNGPAKKDGYIYTRSFKHANVTLDIQKRTAEIIWQDPKK